MNLHKHLFHILFLTSTTLSAQDLSNFEWRTLATTGEVTERHECAFVEFEGKFYLIGGRGINPVNVFDPNTNDWSAQKPTPIEIHHFQPVVFEEAIYIIGAMTGKYPRETPLEHIWIYHPIEDEWEKGAAIPESVRRGGAGAVVFEEKIYLVCGIDYGHTSGTSNLFHSYNPHTGEWATLTKAPTIRDHFSAVVANGKLYCIGGRNTSFHEPDDFKAFFGAINPYIDVYDFEKAEWKTLPEKLPVPSAAGGVIAQSGQIVYFGGESNQPKAHNETYSLNLETGEWTQLAPLQLGRHGSQAISYNGEIYFAAGSPNRGGGNMNSIEKFGIK